MVDSGEKFRGLWRLQDRDLGLVVAYCASQGVDVERSPGRALALCRTQAEAGDPKAQHALAKLLWIGGAGGRDETAAAEWCARSSEQGYLPATIMLAGFYSTGIGVAVDYRRSIELLNAAAGEQSAEAMSLLGASYEYGLGVTKDHAKAIELWRSAAILGNADAQYHLGAALIESDEPGAVADGIAWLRSAANGGHYAAHYALADAYETGTGGLPIDAALATYHREMAGRLVGEK